MREIKFSGRATSLTRYTVDALAWATNRRGHNSWKGINVIDDVYQYLVEHSVDLTVETVHKYDPRMVNRVLYVNPHNITYTMKRLVNEGYATMETTGKRFTLFEFKPDVILTGHGVRFKNANKQAEARQAVIDAKAAGIVQRYADSPDIALPMPEIPHVRYHATELNELLDIWSERDPEAYAKYVDQLEMTLKVLLG